MGYIEFNESAARFWGNDIKNVLNTIAKKYIADNPKIPYVLSVFSSNGIKQDLSTKYDINLGECFPDATVGSYSFAAGLYYSHQDDVINTAMQFYSPVDIYLNGNLLAHSDTSEEITGAERRVRAEVRKGYNTFIFKIKKTPVGFGCRFGGIDRTSRSLNFYSPFAEREGVRGLVYSEPFCGERKLPDLFGCEKDTELVWFPETDWKDDTNVIRRLFGEFETGYVYCWSKLHGQGVCRIYGSCSGKITIYHNDLCIFDGIGDFQAVCKPGDIVVKCTGELEIDVDGGEWIPPANISGIPSPWVYMGVTDMEYAPSVVRSFDRIFKPDAKCDDLQRGFYWKADMPGGNVRKYFEPRSNFSEWMYPVGVTLYGLLQTGRALGDTGMVKYVEDHYRSVINTYEYNFWEETVYGCATHLQKLIRHSLLDDYGSMASGMLETGLGKALADEIAGFIERDMERQEDGTLYRISQGTFMQDTMWADDLYMSTPFLMRYYKLTGERQYIDDAANQFLGFKKYLYIPEEQLMCHVYSFRHGAATKIPWGRGNGWCLFSLSELLGYLPQEHEQREELEKFFRELCQGCIKLQGDNGWWHQVLNRSDSYEETSCTAMFIYAFCRGIRLGILEEKETYLDAAKRAWKAITTDAVDVYGNVYGVCRGSKYSFDPDYYISELLWQTNDTHGIGIVLLAGGELINAEEYVTGRRDV